MARSFWSWYSDLEETKQIWRVFLPIFILWIAISLSTFIVPTQELFEIAATVTVWAGIFTAIGGIFFVGSIIAAVLANKKQ